VPEEDGFLQVVLATRDTRVFGDVDLPAAHDGFEAD